ncbi:universal stress protein [Sinomonas flava]|jgi:nucleotide-binding universal stress UspA family protein|uniref:Universal stress protein n=1 Tax=Sinomonas flava TaxID=496857 RepID=A0ABP5NJN9_9MICC
MTGPIIVGVDGSITAEKAAEAARDLARALDAPLHVMCAFEKDRTEVMGSGSDTWIMSDAETAVGIAKNVALGLEAPGLTVTYSAGRGKPAEALVAEAERLAAHMIVVGNRRMQGLGRVLGSVASSVAHNAPCDVYIVKTVGE